MYKIIYMQLLKLVKGGMSFSGKTGLAIVSCSVQSAEAGEHNQDKSITATHIIVYMVFSCDAHDGWMD